MTSPATDYVIRKGGYFYRPNKAGYCASVYEAGRYTQADAEAEAVHCPEVSAHPLSDWLTVGAAISAEARVADLEEAVRRAHEWLTSSAPTLERRVFQAVGVLAHVLPTTPRDMGRIGT